MTRTGQAAIDYARSRVGGQMPAAGYCLQFVRQCFDVGSYYGSAIDAWNGAQFKHPGDRNPPPAVPLYFYTPSVYDHVTFCVSTGEVISTFNEDIKSFSGISDIERQFDGSYIGWAEDINGVRVYTAGEEEDMTPEQAQQLQELYDRRGSIDQTKDWSGQTTAAVGRLEGLWGATDGRNRVGDFDQTNDWSQQTTEAVGRIESDLDEGPVGGSQAWTPSAVIAALAFVALALMVVAVFIISAVAGDVPNELERATVYLAFVLAGGVLGRWVGSRHG